MKTIRWNESKNELLLKKRGLCFEEVLLATQEGRLLAIEQHPKRDLYPTQKILVVVLKGYVHIVPFVETEDEIFLKTIYPDRKYHKKYEHKLTKEPK